jgi:hypothetical protein
MFCNCSRTCKFIPNCIMMTCIIFHNIIIEDDHHLDGVEGNGSSRKFFQGIHYILEYNNITKKKNYMKFYTILLQVFEYNNITKKKNT